jgi:hypothetical protein
MQEERKVSIDVLAPQKSHIDLSDKQLPTDFGLENYVFSKLFDDVILVEYCDIQSDELGNEWVERNGIAIPINQVNNAWRKGKVILKGPNVKYTEIGDIVVFPNNMGIGISNLEVKGHGKVKNGLFLNEQRMFGVCELNA